MRDYERRRYYVEVLSALLRYFIKRKQANGGYWLIGIIRQLQNSQRIEVYKWLGLIFNDFLNFNVHFNYYIDFNRKLEYKKENLAYFISKSQTTVYAINGLRLRMYLCSWILFARTTVSS
jgi:hypothetical protein